jgi:hypothetical protein
MSQAAGVSTALWQVALLHSEVIWRKVFLLSDKLTKPFVKAHGQHLIRLSGWSIYALLVVVAVAEQTMLVEVVRVVCSRVWFLLRLEHLIQLP